MSLTMSIAADMNTRSCNCIGPQKGQPRCPCMMQGIVERDGRWVQLERDLGPVRPLFDAAERAFIRQGALSESPEEWAKRTGKAVADWGIAYDIQIATDPNSRSGE